MPELNEDQLIDVGDGDEKAVDVELDDKGEATVTEVDNPNIDDQLDTAAGEKEEEVTTTPQQRVDEYLSKNEEAEEYSRKVKKRINKATYDLREAERQKQAAIDYAQGVQKEMAELKTKQTEQDGVFINEHKSRVQSNLEGAQQVYKDALEANDPALIAEANVNIARFAAQLTNAEQTETRFKRHVESRPAEEEVKPYAPPPPDNSQQPVTHQPDERAAAWAEKNTWFGENNELTNAALQIHQQLVTNEGFLPSTDAYYDQLDVRIRKNYPKNFEKPRMSASQSVNAVDNTPVARKAGKRNVRLTASQVAIAKKLGLTLEQYAKYV